jgi:hypothetical protein
MQAFSTARVSSTSAAGMGGKSLKGRSGCQLMMTFQRLGDTSSAYVAGGDMSITRVGVLAFGRHEMAGT